MWGEIIGAGISAAANLLGGATSASSAANINQANINAQQQINNDNWQHSIDMANFNAQQAQNQMEFQWKMGSTAYQRATADMRAAGINPLLAYQQGGNPMGAGASGSGSVTPAVAPQAHLNPGGELGRSMGAAASSAVDAWRAIKQAKLIDEDRRLRLYDQEARKEEIGNIQRDTENKIRQGEKIDAESELVRAATKQAHANTAKTVVDAMEGGARVRNYGEYGSPSAPDTLERILRSLFPPGQEPRTPSSSGGVKPPANGVFEVRPKVW